MSGSIFSPVNLDVASVYDEIPPLNGAQTQFVLESATNKTYDFDDVAIKNPDPMTFGDDSALCVAAVKEVPNHSISYDTSRHSSMSKFETVFQLTDIKGLIARHCFQTIEKEWMGCEYEAVQHHILRRYFDTFVRDIARNGSHIGCDAAMKVHVTSKVVSDTETFGHDVEFSPAISAGLFNAVDALDCIHKNVIRPLDLLCLPGFCGTESLDILRQLLEHGIEFPETVLVEYFPYRRHHKLYAALDRVAKFNEFARRTYVSICVALTDYLMGNSPLCCNVVKTSPDIDVRAHRVRILSKVLRIDLNLDCWYSLISTLLLELCPDWDDYRRYVFECLRSPMIFGGSFLNVD